MKARLDSCVEVTNLARQLDIDTNNAVEGLLAFCDQRIRSFIHKFKNCETLSGLLEVSAQECGTRFEVIDSGRALDAMVAKYVARNESAFAILEQEFMRGVLGITLRLQAPQPWELPFVSVIDMRGDRRYRAYFTKWHEIAHLLLLADNKKTVFHRNHYIGTTTDAEEALVDLVAGRCAYCPALIAPHATSEISFHEIDRLRMRLCPESSKQAARLGFTAAWPSACILLECRIAAPSSGNSPHPPLRATSVMANEAARSIGVTFPPLVSVPARSVISHTFGHIGKAGRAVENLSWWLSNRGGNLPSRQVRVEALGRSGAVDALLIPI